MSSEKFCLKWNDFQNNVSESFRYMRDDQDFCDVTLASEGNHHINAHKVILAASSPFYMEMLKSNKHNHPLIYMRGVRAKDLVAIVDFIYHGEANIYQEDLDSFLVLAEELQLKGLNGDSKITEKLNQEPNYEILKIRKSTNENYVAQNDSKITSNEVESYLESNDIVSNSMVLDDQLKTEILQPNDLIKQLDSMMERLDGVWICKTCGKTNKEKRDARRHAETHIEGVSHPCNICGKLLRSSTALRMHVYKKHV